MSTRLQGVTLTHADGHIALNKVSLALQQGEQVAIIGPSGAGKTSLLRLLATGLRSSSGTLEILGQQPWVLGNRARRLLRSRIGLIHQNPPLPPRQRVVTAVLAGRLGQWSLLKSLTSLIYPLDIPGARRTLERLDLSDKLFVSCDRLSGGQLQRVGIARVLYQEPDLILADEPVAAMDPVLADHCLALMCQDAQQRGATLITSLHAVDLALAHFPRIIGLRDGRILFDRSRQDIGDDDLARLYANEQLAYALQDHQDPSPRLPPLQC